MLVRLIIGLLKQTNFGRHCISALMFCQSEMSPLADLSFKDCSVLDIVTIVENGQTATSSSHSNLEGGAYSQAACECAEEAATSGANEQS
jgi:hypothetical protein